MQIKEVICQQDKAREVLHKLEAVDPACILAGGAPRSWFLGKVANDLDFYVWLYETEAHTALRFKRLGLDVKLVDFASDAWKDYGLMKYLFRIYEGEYRGEKIQVMCMKVNTFNSVVNHFGVSVCKFWWKGSKVMPTNEALVSLINKTLYIADDYTAKESHVKKMVGYFPEFKIDKLSEVGNAYEGLISTTMEEYLNFHYHTHYNKKLLGLLPKGSYNKECV